MNLPNLIPGDLLKLNDRNLICWFSSHPSQINDFKIPRIKVGSKESYDFDPCDQKKHCSSNLILYIGLDSHYKNSDIIRQMRLVYIDGIVGYIECYDFKYLTI
jgi:hypothetical protein